MQFQSEAAQRWNDELDRRVGRIEDGQGRKIYRHRRIAEARRMQTLAALRGDVSVTTTEPQKSAIEQSKATNLVTTTLPSAARAGLFARAACLLVAVASIVAGLAIDGTAFGIIASLPAPKLIAGAFGRAV